MKILNSVGTNKKSNKVRCNLPTPHTQPESCGNIGKDAILDISGFLVIYDVLIIMSPRIILPYVSLQIQIQILTWIFSL